ncbi:MAG: transglutaminase family protein [Planctomycetes bacterium]|nr:transglutaminase family protein [Planctomycetota bacterium]
MRFFIQHQTRYQYSAPVFLEPHVVRLTPRTGPTQRLHRFDLTIDPVPIGRVDGLDAECNCFTQIWFEGLHAQLTLHAEMEVETWRGDPFAGLLTDAADRLPLVLSRDLQTRLSPYLSTVDNPLIETWARKLMDGAGGDTLSFLSRLCSDLYSRVTRVRRMEPGIQPAVTTLESHRGACRDLALLFIEASRSVGIPARFVSGYQRLGDDITHPDLHAWAEVFLPGLGWRGYDAAQGLAVADDHVALAASADPDQTAPVTGSLRGEGKSSVDFSIKIETSEQRIS